MQRPAILRAPRIAAASSLLVAIALAHPAAHAQTVDSTGVRAVPTYESVGLDWSNAGANSNGCDVQYRKQGEATWHPALNLWYDASNGECRGSIVYLT
ncbi:MAG TPA: hypothetical protein VLS49_15480, partial [Usitatibacter sp.]|nr:hypothetical protein [Usitatibacter sp.]